MSNNLCFQFLYTIKMLNLIYVSEFGKINIAHSIVGK